MSLGRGGWLAAAGLGLTGGAALLLGGIGVIAWMAAAMSPNGPDAHTWGDAMTVAGLWILGLALVVVANTVWRLDRPAGNWTRRRSVPDAARWMARAFAAAGCLEGATAAAAPLGAPTTVLSYTGYSTSAPTLIAIVALVLWLATLSGLGLAFWARVPSLRPSVWWTGQAIVVVLACGTLFPWQGLLQVIPAVAAAACEVALGRPSIRAAFGVE